MSLRNDLVTTGCVKVFQRIVLGFCSTLLLTRCLGPRGLGLYTALLIAPLISQSLGSLGICQAGTFVVGKRLVPEARLVGALVSLWGLNSACCMILVLAIYCVQGMHAEGLMYMVVGVSLVPAGLTANYANGVVLGRQWIARFNVGEIVYFVVRLVCLVAFLTALNGGVLSALSVELLAIVAQGILLLYWIRRDVRTGFRPLWDTRLIQLLVTHGLRFAMALFVFTLHYRVGVLILSRCASHGEVGQFSLAMSIAALIWMIPDAVGMVTFSHSAATPDGKRFAQTTAQIMRLTLLVSSVCALCIAVLCRPVVAIVFGQEYLPSVPAIRIMLPGCVAAVIIRVLHADLSARGYPLVAVWVCLAALAVNVGISLALVHTHGTIGVATASTISYLAGALVYAFIYARMSNLRFATVFFRPHDDWCALRGAGRIVFFSDARQ